jgi:hypothetical protein
MKMLADPVLPFALPLAALVAAAGLLSIQSKRLPARTPASNAPPELVRALQGKRRFTQDDVPIVVDAMHRAGIDQFVCKIDPSSGAVNMFLGNDLTPHLDIKPGSCPNPLQIHGGGAAALVPTGLLGNAFDVTQVDLNSVRMSRGSSFSMATGNQVAPIHVVLADVGTPFDGSQCDCAALGPDGVLDILIQYDKQGLIDGLGLGGDADGSSVPLRTTGLVGDGCEVFSAIDCVRIQQH